MKSKIKFSWIIEEFLEFLCGIFKHDYYKDGTDMEGTPVYHCLRCGHKSNLSGFYWTKKIICKLIGHVKLVRDNRKWVDEVVTYTCTYCEEWLFNEDIIQDKIKRVNFLWDVTGTLFAILLIEIILYIIIDKVVP